MNRYLIPFFAAISLTAGAAQPDFDAAVESIVAADASLTAAKRHAEAQSIGRRADNTLANPEVEFEYLFSNNSAETDRYSFGVTQEFDWLGAYSARRHAASVADELEAINLLALENTARREASQLIVDLVAAKLEAAELARIAADYDGLLKLYTQEYAKGNVTILDLNKIRIESANYAAMLSEKQRDIAELRAGIAAISSADALANADAIEAFPSLSLEPYDTYAALMEQSPELLTSSLSARLAHAESAVARNENLPGFSLGYSGAHEDGTWFHGFKIAASLPVWSAAKRNKAAAIDAEATSIDAEGTFTSLEARLKGIYSNASTLQDQIKAYGDAIVASDNIGLLHRAFDAGQITLSEYITDLSYFVNADIQFIELQRQFNRAILQMLYI